METEQEKLMRYLIRVPFTVDHLRDIMRMEKTQESDNEKKAQKLLKIYNRRAKSDPNYKGSEESLQDIKEIHEVRQFDPRPTWSYLKEIGWTQEELTLMIRAFSRSKEIKSHLMGGVSINQIEELEDGSIKISTN